VSAPLVNIVLRHSESGSVVCALRLPENVADQMVTEWIEHGDDEFAIEVTGRGA